MTKDEFEAGAKALCANCAAGIVVRLRVDTNEWVHDQSVNSRASFAHSLCQANAFRKANIAEVIVNGQ